MQDSVDIILTSVTRLTEYWNQREMQHKSFCGLLQLVLVNQANFAQTHSTEYLISTVVPRLMIILSELGLVNKLEMLICRYFTEFRDWNPFLLQLITA